MTLIQRIKAGEVPEIVTKVASFERVNLKTLLEHIVQGKVVIPQNIGRTLASPAGIGKGMRTKINANLGTSADFPYLQEELKKLEVAIRAGADTVMDLSTGGDLDQIRRDILKRSAVPVGTVPIYQAAVEAQQKKGGIVEMTPEDLFRVIEKQAEDGVDFVTVHCGVTTKVLDDLSRTGRITSIVSRGGTFLAGWIRHNEQENPLYEGFDRLLDLARRYDLTLSLGDGLRPGCLADATDKAQISELSVLAELVDRARDADVQVIVEGPGHVPLNQIEANVKLQKELCKEAPFYVLGPLVTDVAPGYDHIVAAIGGTLAAFYGADFLCYVTPREHLGLPTVQDVKEGTVASRIAAHAADIAKGVPGASDWDLKMARARADLNWKDQIELAMDSQKAQEAHEERKGPHNDACTMCGDYCALKLASEYLKSSSTGKC